MSIIKTPSILLPNKDVNLEKWATIACDQYTSEPNYWKDLENFVGDAPSATKVTFAELYLSKDNTKHIEQINSSMRDYLNNNILKDVGKCFVLVARQTKINPLRLGLVLSVDLEAYSFRAQDKALIRATEGTVIERIPPRVKIRQNALIELPHIMLLFDDREQHIIETLYQNRNSLQKLYDFNLNMGGGHITGYRVDNCDEIIEKFDKLITSQYLLRTFNTEEKMMFAVGDGNHSLATAKQHWDNVKQNLSESEKATHPARFALVEATNIHDKGIVFEPIYRAMFGVGEDFVNGLKNLYTNSGKSYQIFFGNKTESYTLPTNTPLAIKLVQDYIDNYIKAHQTASVDYIHGLDSLRDVVLKNANSVGLTLPTIEKNDLLAYVIKNGALPRKSFSMGEAYEKRYYIEAKKITN